MRPLIALALLAIAFPSVAADIATVALNEYTGFRWRDEPVSWDIALPQPMATNRLSLKETGSCQIEVLEGTPEAASRVRVWTVVSSDRPQQMLFTVTADDPARPAPVDSTLSFADAGGKGGVALADIGNGGIRARVPVGSVRFPTPVSGFGLPGPVVAVSADAGKTWIGDSWIDAMPRVREIAATVQRGAVFNESRIVYDCEGGRRFTARVRVFQGAKPYVELVEDFNLGGASRWIFAYGDWQAKRFMAVRDGGLARNPVVIKGDNPANDYITEQGQRCLARLVIWSQFGYFYGKNETIGLFADDDSLFVGAFYIRPDRWTRAKVNHVDLYQRPEVPGRPITRGVSGLGGAVERIAMEAWLIDGHREWGITALPPRNPAEEAAIIQREREQRLKRLDSERKKKEATPESIATLEQRTAKEIADIEKNTYRYPHFLAKAHILVGVWNLDRINRLPLVWNADGSPVALEHQGPRGALSEAATTSRMLSSIDGRDGLAQFNGSERYMRGGMIGTGKKYLEWARANPGVKAADIDVSTHMAGITLSAYMAMDESTYPGRRAMLPWTDPEALNPFYQGMENMNFNADRYASVAAVGAGLAVAGHPEGRRILDHGREQLDLALDRYVYPDSGCWEESHAYCSHTMKNATLLARNLREMGAKDFFNDLRFAKLFGFWTIAHSPRDPGFGGKRVVAPIGDHGLGVDMFVEQFQGVAKDFAAAKDPQIQRIARHMAWLLAEKKATVPEGIAPERPDLRSRYLQGYGAVLRASDARERETFAIVRAEQSWGHHHADKGSLWFWGRDVHFFGDAAWGQPPGNTYGNAYKQGPASGTQIEFVGVSNWPVPCKYPGPWIADDEYADAYDYTDARCMFPYNPALKLSESSPVALRNGYDRQVLFVKPDLLIVRDNVETVCPTIWRLHSYQTEGTSVQGSTAIMASPQQVIGKMSIVHPPGAVLTVIDKDDLNDKDNPKRVSRPFGVAAGTVTGKGKDGKEKLAPYDTRSVVLKWDMPRNASATWVMGVHDEGEAAPEYERLDRDGHVTRIRLADGREIFVFMNIAPFAYSGQGIDFSGTVGLVVRAGGKTTAYPIRAETLAAK